MSARRPRGRAATWKTSPRGAPSRCGIPSPTTSATPYRRGNRSSSWAVPSRTPGWARTASCTAKSLWRRAPWGTICRRAAPRSSGRPSARQRCRSRSERSGRAGRRPPTARDSGKWQPPPVPPPPAQRTTRAHRRSVALRPSGAVRPGPEGPVPPTGQTRGGVRACPTSRRGIHRTRETVRDWAPPAKTGARGRRARGWSTPVRRRPSLARPLRTAVIRAAARSPRGTPRTPAVQPRTTAPSQRTPPRMTTDRSRSGARGGGGGWDLERRPRHARARAAGALRVPERPVRLPIGTRAAPPATPRCWDQLMRTSAIA